jgi:putative component of membrane protein insertase Oxa1/YidC/SpoIIIJ protein YidD
VTTREALVKTLDSRFCGLFVSSIAWYQRSVSPRKGFACAYRSRTGGASCSQFAREAFRGGGWWTAVRAVVDRFRLCGEAARSLRRERAVACACRGREASLDGEPVDDQAPGPEDARHGACECLGEAFAECCLSGCAAAVWRVES